MVDVSLKESEVELTIKCSRVELDHFVMYLKESHRLVDEDDMDENCDCKKADCFCCYGDENYGRIKGTILGAVKVP